MSVEWNTQQSDRQDERDGHAHLVLFGITFVYTPDKRGCKQDNINYHAGIERHAESVDEQQFEPAAYFYDARYDTVEYGSYEYAGTDECQ